MEVNAAATGQAQSTKAANGLADNFETFLLLLTAQLKNQDPLEPLDSSEFTSQLVQFTSVEQSIATNKHLESLVSLSSASSANAAVSYLGKEVTADSFTSHLSNGSTGWSFTLPEDSTETILTITDKNGDVVLSKTQPLTKGTHTYMWDGKDTNGADQPDGDYNLVIRTRNASGGLDARNAEVTGTVRAVTFENGQPVLEVSGTKVRLQDIISIVDLTGTGA